MRRQIVGIVMLCGFSNSAAPASVWLQHASTEIATLPDDTPKNCAPMKPTDLTIQLCLASPSSERRAFAIETINCGLNMSAAREE